MRDGLSDREQAIAAAERIVKFTDDYEYTYWDGSKTPFDPEQDAADVARAYLRALESAVSIALLKEPESDEDEPIDEAWLPISGMARADTKRLGYIIASRGELELIYCPQCGDLPPCICVGHQVIFTNGTRGQLRALCRALGVKLKEGE